MGAGLATPFTWEYVHGNWDLFRDQELFGTTISTYTMPARKGAPTTKAGRPLVYSMREISFFSRLKIRFSSREM